MSDINFAYDNDLNVVITEKLPDGKCASIILPKYNAIMLIDSLSDIPDYQERMKAKLIEKGLVRINHN